MIDTLPRIQWDTNVFVRALVTESEQLEDFLFKLYKQHQNRLIRFINPISVQSEFYGILAAGRVKIDSQCYAFTRDLFRLDDFIPSLQDLDWKPNQGKDYKETWRQVLKNVYGWDDFGQSYIERRLRYSVDDLGIEHDMYDWPIIASALIEGVDLLVTANVNDFKDPLGRLRIKDAYAAIGFAFEDLHYQEFPREEKA